MVNHPELTAISRTKLSAPTRYMLENDLLSGLILDYGCGKGFDVNYLREIGFKIEGYDPYYFPDYPKYKYNTIICNYVLNVIEKEKEDLVLGNIKELLETGGTAYITVRRDVHNEGYRKRGKMVTYQRNVILDFEKVKENNNFCIYKFSKYGTNND